MRPVIALLIAMTCGLSHGQSIQRKIDSPDPISGGGAAYRGSDGNYRKIVATGDNDAWMMFSAAGQPLWSKRPIGLWTSECRGVVLDQNNHLTSLMGAGHTWFAPDSTCNSAVIFKMDAEGALLWGKKLDMYMASAEDDNVISQLGMVGNLSGELFVWNNSIIGPTKSITKLSGDGDVLWSKQIMIAPDLRLGELQWVEADLAGGCWFAGLESVDGYRPLILGHLDANGGLVWCKRFVSGTAELRYRDLAVSIDGTIVVSATWVNAFNRPMLMRLDVQGSPLWAKRYAAIPGELVAEQFISVHETHAGSIYALEGTYASIFTLDHEGAIENTFNVIPYFYSGDVLYEQSAGFARFTDSSMVMCPTSNVYDPDAPEMTQITGLWDLPMTPGIQNSGDFCLLGNWSGNYAPVDLDSIAVTDVGVLTDAQALISPSPVQIVNDDLITTSDECLFMLANSIPSQKTINLSVYPTLVEQGAWVTVQTSAACEIMLIDTWGRTLQRIFTIGDQSHKLPIAGLGQGMYHVVAQMGNGRRATASVIIR